MSRELAIRVPSEIAAWVRSQSGSASDIAFSLANALCDRKQTLHLADPGAGEDRVKLRLSSRVIQFVRKATHSKDTAAAFRKLLAWGARDCALPESRRAISPAHSVVCAALSAVRAPLAFSKPVTVPRTLAAPVSSRQSECWEGVRISGGLVPAYPSPAMPVARYSVAPVGSQFEEFRTVVRGPDTALGGRAVLAIGVPVALIFGSVYVLKALGGFAAGAKATAAAGAAAKAAPKIAAWIPEVARGLGVLFGA